MAKVLFVKANNRPIDQSISVQLFFTFIEEYKKQNPNDDIIELDLYNENIPYYGNEVIAAMYKSSKGMELTEAEQAAYDTQTKYVEQFLQADKVVIAFPLWNQSVPGVLHTYIDYLNVVGKTFKYTEDGVVGLAGDKKIALLNARGGIYSEGPLEEYEMAVKFIEKNFRQFGITDFTKVIVEGHNQFRDQKEFIISKGIQEAKAAAVVF